MKTLERRLLKVEAAMKIELEPARLTDEELEKRIDVLLARMGTSREQVNAKHGGLEGFRRWLMDKSNDSAPPVQLPTGSTVDKRLSRASLKCP